MSFSDDTAAYLFANYQPHVHDYTFWKADPSTDGQEWLFACDCGAVKNYTDDEMTVGSGGDSPTA